MSAADRAPSSDRRTQEGLSFDAESRWLSLGRFVQEVPADGGNRAVLNAYVELTARSRHDRIANVVRVRDADVRALADALDLDADDLAAEIEAVLGASRAEAIKTINRMRESRLIGGLAKAATGAVVAGSLVAGAGGVAVTQAASEPTPAPMPIPAPAAPRPALASSVPDALRVEAATTAVPASTSASDAAPDDEPAIDGPLTVDEEGVGLIPPVTQDADGSTLIPPATEDRAEG
jgi:hypothetical protein